MADNVNRQILLASRPDGVPIADNFRLAESPVPEPGDGEAVYRTIYMSLDPYMRGRMNAGSSYAAGLELGDVMTGGTVSEVVESNLDEFRVGDFVLGGNGWQEYAVSDGRGVRKLNPADAPISTAVGVLGMPGMTAYVGLLDVGALKDGDRVVVSAASGAVGAVVGQIAKIKGCRVVGVAGAQEKCDYVTRELGFDACLSRHRDDLPDALAAACPDGIDVYFDNVGGDHLTAAIWGMNDRGRIIACGSISTYNETEPPPGPNNLFQIVTKRLRWQGFIVSDHPDRAPAFAKEMGGWIADRKVVWRETVHEGIENAPQAFLGLFAGGNMGKMVVRLASGDS